MRRTILSGEVMSARTEHQLAIPADTVRIQFISRGFPIRISFLAGEVAATPPKGFVVGSTEYDLERIGQFQGPIYYAADQPHALLAIACWSDRNGGVPGGGGGLGGAFDPDAFDSGFDIGP